MKKHTKRFINNIFQRFINGEVEKAENLDVESIVPDFFSLRVKNKIDFKPSVKEIEFINRDKKTRVTREEAKVARKTLALKQIEKIKLDFTEFGKFLSEVEDTNYLALEDTQNKRLIMYTPIFSPDKSKKVSFPQLQIIFYPNKTFEVFKIP